MGAPSDTYVLSLPPLSATSPGSPTASQVTSLSPPLTLQGAFVSLKGCNPPPLIANPSRFDGSTGQTSKLASVNFAPEKSALRNERHPRLLDCHIGVTYL